jgi:hypothetical protein
MKRFCTVHTAEGERVEGYLKSGIIAVDGKGVDPFEVQSVYTEHRKTFMASHKLTLTLESGTQLKTTVDGMDGHIALDVPGLTGETEIDLSDIARLEARPVNE